MKIKITKKGRAVQIPVHFVAPIPPEAPEQPKVATPEEEGKDQKANSKEQG